MNYENLKHIRLRDKQIHMLFKLLSGDLIDAESNQVIQKMFATLNHCVQIIDHDETHLVLIVPLHPYARMILWRFQHITEIFTNIDSRHLDFYEGCLRNVLSTSWISDFDICGESPISVDGTTVLTEFVKMVAHLPNHVFCTNSCKEIGDLLQDILCSCDRQYVCHMADKMFEPFDDFPNQWMIWMDEYFFSFLHLQ